MELWQRRAIGVLVILGGVFGVFSSLIGILMDQSLVTLAFSGFFATLYLWGAWLGLRILNKDDSKLGWLMVFWLIQVPIFSSPYLTYFFSSGFHLTSLIQSASPTFNIFFGLGNEFRYSFLVQDEPWGLGVNVFAVVVCLWLFRVRQGISPNYSLKRTNQSLRD